MQERYRVVAEDQERDLTQAAANEENKARLSDDAVERFRARRTAELLASSHWWSKASRCWLISPSPSYDEQKTLADHADIDFASIKELLEDGKVSRLDAIRLNNEFRRIGPERDRLLKNRDGRGRSAASVFTRMRSRLSSSSSSRLAARPLRARSLARALDVVALGRRRGPDRASLEQKHRPLLIATSTSPRKAQRAELRTPL